MTGSVAAFALEAQQQDAAADGPKGEGLPLRVEGRARDVPVQFPQVKRLRLPVNDAEATCWARAHAPHPNRSSPTDLERPNVIHANTRFAAPPDNVQTPPCPTPSTGLASPPPPPPTRPPSCALSAQRPAML